MNDPRELRDIEKGNIKYSICTLVTKHDVYKSLVSSFWSQGFDGEDCEFLFANNNKDNRYDGFGGVNKFLRLAKGEYIIICHQDLVLLSDDRAKLDSLIEELDRIDPAWALFGNAGGISPGRLALRISDPYGEDQKCESYPIRVRSLDENFIVVRRDANLAVSHDLVGFHMYGTDLCIMARILGRSAYVVDFHLRHLSAGTRDASFFLQRDILINKFSRALKPQWVQTPSTLIYLHPNRIVSILMNLQYVVRSRKFLGRLFRSWEGKNM